MKGQFRNKYHGLPGPELPLGRTRDSRLHMDARMLASKVRDFLGRHLEQTQRGLCRAAGLGDTYVSNLLGDGYATGEVQAGKARRLLAAMRRIEAGAAPQPGARRPGSAEGA